MPETSGQEDGPWCRFPRNAVDRIKPIAFKSLTEDQNGTFLIETISLKQTSLLSVVIAAVIATPVALNVLPYQADPISRARSEGKVTAIQFHSGWCPVCVMQERGVKALINDNHGWGHHVVQADYFEEEALRRRFRCFQFLPLWSFSAD